MLQPGYAPITIVNRVSSNTAATGDLQSEGVNPDNIWLQQVGNNLQVDIMGSQTHATIENWFSNPYSSLSELTVTGGSSDNLVLDSQVNQFAASGVTMTRSADRTAVRCPAALRREPRK